MLVFKNYKRTKVTHEDLVEVRILDNEEIFVELPFALIDFDNDIKTPVIFGNLSGIPLIVDLQEVLRVTKMFHLKRGEVDEDTGAFQVIETNETDSEAEWHLRLPKETPIEQLAMMGNQPILIEKVEKEVDKE